MPQLLRVAGPLERHRAHLELRDPRRRIVDVVRQPIRSALLQSHERHKDRSRSDILRREHHSLSVAAADFDGDGDLDLAVVANDPEFGPAVRVLENVGASLGTVGFAPPVTYTVGATPQFLASADFNDDNKIDLVTVNSDAVAAEAAAGPTGGSVTVLLNTPASAQTAPCPAEITGDGDVNVLDLIELVMSFGPCEGCPADLNDDGVVNVLDVIELIMSFGPCPGTPCVWDVNGDGVVDRSDLQRVLANFGPCDGCPEDVNSDGVVDGSDVQAVATRFQPSAVDDGTVRAWPCP